MTQVDAEFRWRPILLPAYGPTALASIGYGALAPVVALTAISLGAGVGLAAFVVGLAPLGQLVGDLPAGALAARIGEKRALISAGLVDAASMLIAFLSRSLLVLGMCVFVSGIAASVFNLARHAWMTEAIPPRYRARALSSLGGTFRVGLFVGPFVTALLVAHFNLHAVFLFAACTGAAAALLTQTLPDLTAGHRARMSAAADRPTIAGVVRANVKVLLTVGVGILLLSAARASRPSILPLWAQSQGLSASTISILFGISSGLEIALVYPGGALMDRFGRAAAAVPAIALMGLALGLLPLTHTPLTVGAVCCLMAVGSGLSSGMILTLGSDVAPPRGRPQFLGAWRLFADGGALLGPALIVVISAVGPLALAALGLAGLAAVGAGWLGVWVPRMVTHHPRMPRPAR